MNVSKILDIAIEADASDVHLTHGLKPIMRNKRELVNVGEEEVITPEDMYEAYEFFVQGSIEKDEIYKKTRRIDCAYEHKGIRLRINISSSDNIPTVTLRIIKNTLPTFKELGVPDVVRRMTYQPQGLVLVTGKTNSGKSTTLNALISEINNEQNKKILTLEKPVEYRHTSNKSMIIQKEIGSTADVPTFKEGVINALREDCDILVIGEIRDKETMEAAIDMAESGHLVIGTLHTKSCAETLDRIINFYEVSDQATIKYLMSAILKLVVSQRLLKSTDGGLALLAEVMVVDNVVAGCIRREKFSVSEVEDAIQGSLEKGSIGLINAVAKLFVEGKITLEQAKGQIEEKNIEVLNRTIMQMKIKQNSNIV